MQISNILKIILDINKFLIVNKYKNNCCCVIEIINLE